MKIFLFVLLLGVMFACDGKDEPIVQTGCESMSCTINAHCILVDSAPSCVCNNGYHAEELLCVEDQNSDCSNYSCESNSHCELNDNTPTCVCDNGYHLENSVCVIDVVNLCESYSCQTNAHCVVTNNEASCVCNSGYHLENSNCIKDMITCDDINCPSHSSCEMENQKPICFCDDDYVVNSAGTGCVFSCDSITCPANSHCEATADDGGCFCDTGFEVNSSGDACVSTDPDYPFINFHIWRATNGYQAWAGWSNKGEYYLREMTVTTPAGRSTRTTYYSQPHFESGYDEAWLLSDEPELEEGEYTVTFQYQVGSSILEKTLTRVAENQIYLGETGYFTITNSVIDPFDGLKIYLTPNFNGTYQRYNLYTATGAWIKQTSYTNGVSCSSGSSNILTTDENLSAGDYIIVFEGTDYSRQYSYYSGVLFTVTE